MNLDKVKIKVIDDEHHDYLIKYFNKNNVMYHLGDCYVKKVRNVHSYYIRYNRAYNYYALTRMMGYASSTREYFKSNELREIKLNSNKFLNNF